MQRNLRLLRYLAFVVVFGGLIVLATRLHGAAAVVVWVAWAVLLIATVLVSFGTKPSLRFDAATQQVFARWQAAHPDRDWGWTKADLPDPTARIHQQNPALLGRITTNPPVGFDAVATRLTFLGHAQVAGREVLVMELGRYDGSLGTVISRFTNVSVDTPGLVQPVCLYPRSGYQSTGWYRALSFWRFTTGDAAFDARFRVDAENRQAARRLLTPQVTGFLVADPRSAHVGVTFQRGTLNVWLTGPFDDVHAIPPMIDLMMELFARVPARVWTGVA